MQGGNGEGEGRKGGGEKELEEQDASSLYRIFHLVPQSNYDTIPVVVWW